MASPGYGGGIAYEGYPPVNPVSKNQQTNKVIVVQPRRGLWPTLSFLKSQPKLRLVEDSGCCTSWTRERRMCCRRKVFVNNGDDEKLGFAALSNKCCADERGLLHDIFVPDQQLALQTRAYGCCLPWRMECISYKCVGCAACVCCEQDIKIVDIVDDDQNLIGSFEYRPVGCCFEMLPINICDKGTFIMKDKHEQTVMEIPHPECCGPAWSRRGAMCLDDNKPFSKWAEPVQIIRSGDGSTAARIILEHEDACQEHCCCAPVKYQLEYIAVESEEEKALLLGTSVVMDYLMLNRKLLNEPPYEISNKVGTI